MASCGHAGSLIGFVAKISPNMHLTDPTAAFFSHVNSAHQLASLNQRLLFRKAEHVGRVLVIVCMCACRMYDAINKLKGGCMSVVVQQHAAPLRQARFQATPSEPLASHPSHSTLRTLVT
eukprot:2495010-Amphidinium_carterae.2